MTTHYKHLFGPVPSRRLGLSLGVDLVPFKTCSFDCIFCQLGRTTNQTIQRREYVPVEEVIQELAEWSKTDYTADFITLSGSGEPTLNSEFGQVMDFVKSTFRTPLALLTNGSLLSDPEVRRDAKKADVLKISLSAFDQSSFEHINRPHQELDLKRMLEGIMLMRKEFHGEIWMEVFLVWGTNTTVNDVSHIASLVKEIGPDKIQLNTAVRPPCEDYAYAVPPDMMPGLSQLFEPHAEVIADYSSKTIAHMSADEDKIMQLLQRRPCTIDQICQGFGLHRNEASKYIGKLLRNKQIKQYHQDDSIYYIGAKNAEAEIPKRKPAGSSTIGVPASPSSSTSSSSSKNDRLHKTG
ncbi:MAG: radical SAM protein [Verrucomicrobiota bacterium]